VSTAGLTLRQAVYTNKAFWRNPASAFFTFAFPLMFLVIFTALLGNGDIEVAPGVTIQQSTYYVAYMAAFSVITACYTNIAISVTFARDSGVLKRVRGTPLPGSSYLLGRIIHAMLVAILLVVICAAFGAAFYDASVPAGGTLLRFAVMVLVGAASFCALGLAVTAIIPNADASPAIVNATILPLLFISGIFIPIGTDAPQWMITIGNIFPVKHFGDGMLAGFLGKGFAFKWSDVLIVAIWGVAGLLLAARFFSWEPRR
jgi:ABC-2 type transport system permease protein